MCGSRTPYLFGNGSDLYLGGICLEFRRDTNSFEIHFVICISLQANATIRLSEERALRSTSSCRYSLVVQNIQNYIPYFSIDNARVIYTKKV